MASLFVMQARSSVDGQLYPWLAVAVDWAGAGYTGPGLPQDIALAGGGVDTTAGTSTGSVVTASGSVVTTASGAFVTTPSSGGTGGGTGGTGSLVTTASGAFVTTTGGNQVTL